MAFMLVPGLFGEMTVEQYEEWRSKLVYPHAKLTIKVQDEDGNPVEGAIVWCGFDQYDSVKEPTGPDGIYVFEGRSSLAFSGNVQKEGYHYYQLPQLRFPNLDGDRSLPWNPTVEVTLRRKVNPHVMNYGWLPKIPPVMGEEVGFDLMIGDWLPPHGSGKISDVFFRIDGWMRKREGKMVRGWNTDVKLTLRFPNQGDGIIMFSQPEIGSLNFGGDRLRFPREAPLDGYAQSIVWGRQYYHQPLDDDTLNKYELIKRDDLPDQSYLMFRFRTVMDPQGNILRAHYGKAGPVSLEFYSPDRWWLDGQFWINTEPNERNLEDAEFGDGGMKNVVVRKRSR